MKLVDQNQTCNQSQQGDDGAKSLKKQLNLAGKLQQRMAIFRLYLFRRLQLGLCDAPERQSACASRAQAFCDLV